MDPLMRAPSSDSGADTVPDGLAEPVTMSTGPHDDATAGRPVEFAAAPSSDPLWIEPGIAPRAADTRVNERIDAGSARPGEGRFDPNADPRFDPHFDPSLDPHADPLSGSPTDSVIASLSPAVEPAPEPARSPAAVVDVLDRDGQVRQSFAVAAWPLRVGRALDNDIVLSDPHVAASHLTLARGAAGLAFAVGASRNGLQVGRKRWRDGESGEIALDDDPVELTLGRTRLRVRLPEQPVPAEQPLASATPLWKRMRTIVIAALVLVLGLVFSTYLDTDPDGFGRTVGNMLLTSTVGAAIWCSAWALLSKTFTRQSYFGWHLRVFLLASIAILVAGALPALLAFSLSWGWITDFAFVGVYAVGGIAFYFHLLAVEPGRRRLLRWVAATGALAAIGLTLWFNQQRSDQYGDELYMNHLFPPALRLARPVPTDRFINDLASLKATLDKKAKDTSAADDGSPRGDDD